MNKFYKVNKESFNEMFNNLPDFSVPILKYGTGEQQLLAPADKLNFNWGSIA